MKLALRLAYFVLAIEQLVLLGLLAQHMPDQAFLMGLIAMGVAQLVSLRASML